MHKHRRESETQINCLINQTVKNLDAALGIIHSPGQYCALMKGLCQNATIAFLIHLTVHFISIPLATLR